MIHINKKRTFIREKKIFCGDKFLEVDIIPRTESGKRRKGIRSKKTQVSQPKQKNLNDKIAKRYFVQLINTNFDKEDIHTTVTYSDQYLPDTIEAAEREVQNYIRRIKRAREKEGLPPLKYILVTECSCEKDSEKPVRIHHHIIMNGGLDRNRIEDIWRRPRKKGQKEGDKLGYANTSRLQPTEFGLEAIARYLTKTKGKGKKRWSCSQNLEKPWTRNNDYKYSRRKVEKIARGKAHDPEFWSKQYPSYALTECKTEYNDITGWALYLKLRKLEC